MLESNLRELIREGIGHHLEFASENISSQSPRHLWRGLSREVQGQQVD